MKNEEILHTVKDERNILCKTTRKVNSIGHIFRMNCFLKRIIDGKKAGAIEVTGRKGRRCKLPLKRQDAM